MNKQKFICLILSSLVLISFTACNEAEDSVPSDVTTENIDFISPSIEDTESSLDYTLPDDNIIIEITTTEEDTSIITYVNSSDENATTSTPDENITTSTPDENITTSTPDENITTSTPDKNITTSTPDENITILLEEEIVIAIEYTTGFVGKLIDSFVSGIDYTCDGETKKTDYLGQFNCKTTPIHFSIGNLSLGTIEKMTEDYLIFPQDLLNLQRGAALHPDVTKMAILFQSLDNDANSENGIVINQSVITLLNQELTQITNIQDITLIQLTSSIKKVIEATQLQLVTKEQAEDHLLKSLSTILISPIQP